MSTSSPAKSQAQPALIPLLVRKEVVGHARVDAADFEALSRHRWSMIKSGLTYYAYRCEHIAGTRGTRTFYMHRVVLGLPQGAGHGTEGDHIDHDGLNNTRANLRAVTVSANRKHRRPYTRRVRAPKGLAS